MYQRVIFKYIKSSFFKAKLVLLIGARQVGKTTLLKELIASQDSKRVLSFNCDYLDDRDSLRHEKVRALIEKIKDKEIILIDEAQKVLDIGETLKILVDEFKGKKQIIATGSSSINLLDEVSETLTGRKITMNLFPLSYQEILQSDHQIDDLLVYGSYPEVMTQGNKKEKIKLLEELSSSYLYKDVLELEDIKKSSVLDKLIKLLALQIGSEISFNNLSKTLGIDIKTVEKYIQLLERAFVIKLLAPYSIGGKREITKKHKVYFMDLGIRNAVLNNYNETEFRVDKGMLWENFLVIERMKFLKNSNIPHSLYFWRTYDGAEIDLVESRDGKLFGYEFKYQGKPRSRPKQWLEQQNASYQVINRDNFQKFLLEL